MDTPFGVVASAIRLSVQSAKERVMAKNKSVFMVGWVELSKVKGTGCTDVCNIMPHV